VSKVRPEEAEKPFVISLDIGSSSVRAILFDRQGRRVGDLNVRRMMRASSGRKGASVADAHKELAAVCDVLDELLSKCGTLKDYIAAVGFSCFAGNIVGVDARGDPVTPVTTYADTRASDKVDVLREKFEEDQIHNRTGCFFHPSYLPARFLWIAEEQPDWLKKSKTWMTLGSYIRKELLGKTSASYSLAAWNGLLDIRKLTYDAPLLEALPISGDHLLPLVNNDEGISGLKPEYASRWPALKDVPWFPDVGDGAAANIGSGCTSEKEVAITIGTTSAVRVALKNVPDKIPKGLWCYCIDNQLALLGGALNEGGSVFAWLNRMLRFEDEAELRQKVRRIKPDSHGLTFLPLLSGERSPGYRAEMRGTIDGLSLSTTPFHIARAGLEAISYRIARVFNLLVPSLSDDVKLIASGGALTQSDIWPQMLADVMGYPLVMPGVEEASARGVALMALTALGELKDVADAPVASSQSFEPDMEHHAIYQEAIERQQKLYERMASE